MCSFTDFVSKTNNAQVGHAKDIDVVMPVYHLEYSGNYSKTSKSLFQCCKDQATLNNDGAIVEYVGDNATDLCKFNEIITGQTGNNSTKNVE